MTSKIVCLDDYIGKQGIPLKSYPLRGSSALCYRIMIWVATLNIRSVTDYSKHFVGRKPSHTNGLVPSIDTQEWSVTFTRLLESLPELT